MSSEIEDLHEALFGFRPAKAGTAYERLSAVVLATLGWQEVVHDTTVSAPDKLAGHQLDVTGRHPSGEIQRLIIECKDWAQVVEQSTLDKLVGVRDQLKADAAAVMTTNGYTAGAIAVAVDEDIALLRLRAFDPETAGPYVKTISLTIVAVGSTYSNFDVELMPDNGLPSGAVFQVRTSTDDHLLYLAGSPAETLQEVLQSHGAKIDDEVGSYERQVSFDGGRLLPVEGDTTVPIAGLKWTETVHKSPYTTTEAEGEPMLVLEQLNEKGELEDGRMVVDRDLFAWEIDADGRVTQGSALVE